MLYIHGRAKQVSAMLMASLIALMGLIGSSQTAHAAPGSCIGEPIAMLSDGTILRWGTTIATDPANVNVIHFTLHLPADTSANRVVYLGPHDAPETVDVVADAPAGTYTVDTFVDASVSASAQTTAHVRENNTTATGSTNATFSASVTP